MDSRVLQMALGYSSSKNQLHLMGKILSSTSAPYYVRFVLDSGAEASVLPIDFVRAIGMESQLVDRGRYVVTGTKTRFYGQLHVDVVCEGDTHIQPFFVVGDKDAPCLLGMDVLRECILDLSSTSQPKLSLVSPSHWALRRTSCVVTVCDIAGQKVQCLLDTGATDCFITWHVVNRLGLLTKRSKAASTCYTITGKEDLSYYVPQITLRFLNVAARTELWVCQSQKYELFIGLNVLMATRCTLDFHKHFV